MKGQIFFFLYLTLFFRALSYRCACLCMYVYICFFCVLGVVGSPDFEGRADVSHEPVRRGDEGGERWDG